MKSKKSINRRKFIGSVAATAATITVVPRHVLGKGFVPPSDKILVANIGCGTQGIRELPGMLQNDDIQVVAVCDVNKYSTDYLGWSSKGIISGIRRTLEDPNWGMFIKGIPGGRDFVKQYVDDYYKKFKAAESYKACKSYEDFRELLEKETDLDAVKIMTPDHAHATIAMAAMKKGKHVISHKPIANRLAEGRAVIEGVQKYDVRSHLLAWEHKPSYHMIKKWIDDGVIGNLKEIHNWSVRPVWPQFMDTPVERLPVPEGLNWDLWLGPVPDMPYHFDYTHTNFRGWYDFGGGSIADMGHYSLFPLFRVLGIHTSPISARAYGSAYVGSVNQVCRMRRTSAAFPYSSMFKFQFDKQENLPAVDVFWYDGGMKPFAPQELEEDGRDVGVEGLMFVGDEGKILAGFEGDRPEIIPKKKMQAYRGKKELPEHKAERRSDTWVRAIKTGEESPGSFVYAKPITDMVNLGAAALRSGKKLEFDPVSAKITNEKSANKYLTRDYRKGWELE